MRGIFVFCLCLTLSACGQEQVAPLQAEEGQHAEASAAAASARTATSARTAAQAPPLTSPDTANAEWTVDQHGQAIRFGNEGAPPLMSLACRLSDDPPQLAIIRHAPARPGQQALFPVIGNGMRSRFLVDAGLHEGEWRWEGALPASDPQLDVFTGTRALTATLPGGGMLEITGSRIPGGFVTWCRAGGAVMTAEAEDVTRAQ